MQFQFDLHVYRENSWDCLYHNLSEAHGDYRLKYASLEYSLLIISFINDFNAPQGT